MVRDPLPALMAPASVPSDAADADAVTFQDVLDAHARIRDRVHRTPVMTSRSVDARAGCQVFLKCENLQRAGAFKIRGATNAIAQLSDEERKRGVVTHSSGNHAQAVALAARSFGIKATIVMPESAPAVKRAATEGYGARIVTCSDDLASREATAGKVIEEMGAVLIHPYDDPRIVAGQGTAALELLDTVPDLDTVLVPVGGGGLASGTTVTCHAQDRPVAVVACEPKGADDAFRSLKTGVRVTEHKPKTIADGLLTTLGEVPFDILRRHEVPVVTVGEDEILDAQRFVWERTKLIIEPSSAVPFAALFNGSVDVREKQVGVIVSGGNVDLSGWFEGLRT